MKKASIIICNNNYIAKAIVSLKLFKSKNQDYDLYILGTVFSKISHELAKKHNITLLEKNLKNDFFNLDKRPYGLQYPIECFYRFYIPVILHDYDYIVVIEPDIYTNKSIDIKLEEIEYIAGSFNSSKKIKGYSPIMKDIPTWQEHTNIKFHLEQNRVLGGISIFNIKNLNKINFYQKICNLYKKSWDLNVPRCGDDSLLVLFQSIHPQYFKLYPNHFHTIDEENINIIPKITFFHSVGKYTKYWTNKSPYNEINKYFNNKWIEYLYNHFELDFIKIYYQDIFINIEKVKLTFYYYQKTHNFGDMLMPYILKKISKKENYTFDFVENNKVKILGIGSIMRLAHENTIVCGSGIRDKNQDIKYTNALFVRGPHTRNNLLQRNIYTPPVYGDCGLLLPDFYTPKFKKIYKLGIIPHYVDYSKVSELYGNNPDILIIDVKEPNIERTIKRIAKCEKIISSSLHGLIISDAYNIPNKWIKFSNNINGDDIKFHDYFLSVKRVDKTPIINFNDILETNHITNLIQPVKIEFNKKELQEILFYNKNGFTNYIKYLFAKLQKDNNE